MPELPDSITIILGISSLIAVLLYIREYVLRKKDSAWLQKVSLATKQRSIQLLNAAEAAETQIISDSNYVTQKLIAEYKTQLRNLIKTSNKTITSSQDQLMKFISGLQTKSAEFEEASRNSTEQRAAALFEKLESSLSDFLTQSEQLVSDSQTQLRNLIESSKNSITSSQEQLTKFISDLQIKSAEFEETSKNSTEQRTVALFEKLESRLSNFLIQTEQKTTSSIELELQATRQLIETYKSQQLKLIDENILAMMEQTLNIVLGKKMSLKDQLDLIYEALEKAKLEKFIV